MMSSFHTAVIILVIVSNIVFAKKVHKCIHDTFEKQMREQYVEYSDHQILENGIDRRQLVADSDYEAIRITPYYDPATITTSNGLLSTDQISYIKSLVSASIRYLESFMSVIPVDGPLYVYPCSSFGTASDDSFIFAKCTASTLDGKCGDYAVIPDEHLPETYWYNPATQQTELYKPAGAGIGNADLVIYVTYNDTGTCASGGTLAFAGACNRDQYGRPIAGSLNFCPSVLAEEYWAFDVETTLHEMTHILIFSNGLFNTMYNFDTGAIRDYATVVATGTSNSWIITDKVKEIAQEHFGCDSLSGAPLENSGGDGTVGSHWEQKHLNYEYMGGTAYSALSYVSKFTLALMEDSGWYKVDYNYAERYTWGQNEGCTFLNADCIDSGTSTSNFPQYWCDSQDDDGCSADYGSIGICWLSQVSGIPSQFKYYADNSAGPESHDYCGFKNPNTIGVDFEKVCWDTRGATLDTSTPAGSSAYAVDSRCVDVLTSGGSQDAYCFKHECIDFDSSTSVYNAINITVNTNEVIICGRNDALTTKSITSISGITSMTCPNIDTICGTSTLPFECYWGEYNDELSKCICKVGYIGADCNTQDSTVLVAEATSGTPSPTSSYHSSVCIEGITGSGSFLNARYDYTGTTYQGIPAYYNASVNYDRGVYLYYRRSATSWSFGDNVGDSLIYGECEQYMDQNTFPKLSECASWYMFSGGNLVEQSGITATYNKATCDEAISLSIKIWIQCGFLVFTLFFVY